MTNTFPGVFAGKFTFFSTQQGGPNYYLTTCKVSDGNHGWNYYPGMNAATVGVVEKFLLYKYPDGFYRIQSGDLRWLFLDVSGNFIQYTGDPTQAAAFALGSDGQGNITLSINNQPVYYQIGNNPKAPNLLTLTEVPGFLSSFVKAQITPSLDDIRSSKFAAGSDFTNVILTGQDLSGGINFTSANFTNAQLAGVNFTGATLDQAVMSQTNLQGLNWGVPASAVAIDLTGSNASGCIFGVASSAQPINCTNAKFTGANLTGANLVNLNLQGAQFGNTSLVGATLDYANLTKATLNGVVAVGASFQHGTLDNASAQMGNFIQAVFDDCSLKQVGMGASTYLFSLNVSFQNELNKSNYVQPDLVQAFAQGGVSLDPNAAIEVEVKNQLWQILDPAGPYRLIWSDSGILVYNNNPSFSPATLLGASMQRAVFSTASLSGADLRNVQASFAVFDHADIEDAAFSGANLLTADFTQANLSGADFSNALLLQAKFIGCMAGPGGNRKAISFENALLQGVDFSKATFAGALLTSAVVAGNNGAPLLSLDLSYQTALNNGDLTQITPLFKKAGFDLGTDPSVQSAPFWIIDNSGSNNPSAPKQYTAELVDGSILVYGNTNTPTQMPQSYKALFQTSNASKNLVSAFEHYNLTLALNAPITQGTGWELTPGDDATFILNYRFPQIKIVLETNWLMAYGYSTVLVPGPSDTATSWAFGATINLENALNAVAVGPSGLPFGWIQQGLVDSELFYIPIPPAS